MSQIKDILLDKLGDISLLEVQKSLTEKIKKVPNVHPGVLIIATLLLWKVINTLLTMLSYLLIGGCIFLFFKSRK